MFGKKESNDDGREFGTSTKPNQSVMDQRQQSGDVSSLEGNEKPETQISNYEVQEGREVNDNVNVDHADLDDLDDLNAEPKSVEEEKVIFVPLKDFEGRVNDRDFKFQKGQAVEVTRDLANMLVEDDSRGYIRV